MNKRIIITILLAVITISSINLGMSVKAQDKSDCEGYTQLDVDSISDEEKYRQANDELIALGEAAVKSRTNKFLDVTKYYQSGQSWSDDYMQTEMLKIGEAGCCLTSFSMIQRYLGGTLNPGEVNEKLGGICVSL